MFRRRILLPVAILAALLLPKAASAQSVYGWYTPPYFFSGDMGYYAPPRAHVDSRMDPRLLKAARIAEEKAFPYSTMRCWRYVKQALLQAGAVGAYPTTNYAFQAGAELTNRYGFIRLRISDPYQAPVGAVCVYSGGGAGHVEIRTSHGFASDYRSPWRCKYHLTGVYAKFSA
jgi:hypothetical protein